jgi:hypothetical protein
MAGLSSLQSFVLLAAATTASAILIIILRREHDHVIRRLVVVGLVAKLFGTAVYYRVLEDVYGTGDANRYFDAGSGLAATIRSGALPSQARETGTPFVEFLTGAVFAVTGANKIIGYLVFSLLAYVGMYLFLQAFRTAIPDGDHRRYALLVLLLPTMVFWPSTIGKEPWIVFTLGVASFGAARALRGRPFGYLLVVVGTAGVFAVRPHMAALFVLSLAAAFAVRFRDPEVRTGVIGWVIGLLIVGFGAGYVLVNYSDEVSQSDNEGLTATERVRSSTGELLERTGPQTARGASEFDSRPVRTPIDFVHALFTVPFRPFPWEAHNRQAQLASLEGLALLALVVASLPRLATAGRVMLRRPYVMLAAVYTLGFIVAFSNVGNFGILARQRAQLLPFLVVLLCLTVKDQEQQQAPTAGTSPPLCGVIPGRDGRPPVLTLQPASSTSSTPDTAGAVIPEAGRSEASELTPPPGKVQTRPPEPPISGDR